MLQLYFLFLIILLVLFFMYAYKNLMLGSRKCTDSNNKEITCRELGAQELRNLINN